MKLKNVVITAITIISLSACSYTIKGTGHKDDMGTSNMKVAKECTFAPLWLAPVDENFVNIDMLARKNGIQQIEYAKQKIYPYVLFTRYCTVVKGS